MPDDILDAYQEWLYGFIETGNMVDDHAQLLLYLSGKPFTWTVKRDQDRAEDGSALRSSFAHAFGYFEDFWIGKMPKPCSVLEMMIALAMRGDDIIYDPNIGSRTALLFWCMIDNLGLGRMTKFYFDRDYCDEIVDQFMKRRYLRNGMGGLFQTRNGQIDMRKAEIWYQMGTWISENFL